MGIVCILLGIIVFLGFTMGGVYLAIDLLDYKAIMALSVTSLSTIPNSTIIIVVVGACAFIGLLIGLNLIMHGLTYRKVCQIKDQMRRKP